MLVVAGDQAAARRFCSFLFVTGTVVFSLGADLKAAETGGSAKRTVLSLWRSGAVRTQVLRRFLFLQTGERGDQGNPDHDVDDPHDATLCIHYQGGDSAGQCSDPE
jgi:hypothetical protein